MTNVIHSYVRDPHSTIRNEESNSEANDSESLEILVNMFHFDCMYSDMF